VVTWLRVRSGAPVDGFVLGETKPDATNVGTYSPPITTSSGGTLTFSTDDTLVEDTRFERFVDVTAKRVTFRNCELVGPPSFTPVDRGLVNCSNANCEDVLFDRCRFVPQTPEVVLDAVFGHHFTARRCEVRHVEDGFGVFLASGAVEDVAIEGCWIHDLFYWCPNSFLSDNRSHSDGIQLHTNPRGVTIVGNRIEGFIDPAVSSYTEPTFNGGGVQQSGFEWFSTDGAGGPGGLWGTSAIVASPAGTTLEDVIIDRNWIDGGAVGINFGNWTAGTGLAVTGNRWGRNYRLGEAATGIKDASLAVTTTGNVYEDDGTPKNTWLAG
jgi:hypothetical protein